MSQGRQHDRLVYLDRLRAALVILVVLHHVALVYGAIAPFYYQEPPFTDPLAFLILGVFALANQAWFMGALFLLAGYFTPLSFDRRGAGSFVVARLVRLGIPLVAGLFLLEPLARLGFFLMPAELTGIAAPPTWATYPKLIGLGPLWFIALLLVFTLGYPVWRAPIGRGAPSPEVPAAFPGYVAIALATLALAAVSHLLRMVVPLGRDVVVVLPGLSFPTIAYLPQYLGLFVLGVVAGRRGWLTMLPASAGLVGFLAALVASVILFPLALTGRWFVVAFGVSSAFVGNGTWQSAAYALWDSTMAVGLSLAALVVFHRWFNNDGAFGRFLATNSYAVYVIPAPLVVYVCFALHVLALPALVKFAFAAVIVLPVCFAVAWAIRRVPPVRRVL